MGLALPGNSVSAISGTNHEHGRRTYSAYAACGPSGRTPVQGRQSSYAESFIRLSTGSSEHSAEERPCWFAEIGPLQSDLRA